jgi:cation:H+ antiporter
MEDFLKIFMQSQPIWLLFSMICLFIYTLGKGADILVEEAVRLSVKWRMPRILVGATLVSLGTTIPETAVSVFAALKGSPGIALGNAVGSIICDTGLILGVAAVMKPLSIDRYIVNRQGWIQLAAGVLLVAASMPYSSLSEVFTSGGRLPRHMGIVFLVLLGLYMYLSVRWIAKREGVESLSETEGIVIEDKALAILLRGSGGLLLVLLSSKILIPAVQDTAVRLSVPESIIGATLIAFGTSLPEFVTAITAVRKGYGELAVGNIIGADILNVLFVAGAAASVTRGGLVAQPFFFQLLFPAMLLILVVFRLGVFFSKKELKRGFGVVLLSVYALVTFLTYRYK